MIFQTFKIAVLVAALATCGVATAQDCGGCESKAGMDYEVNNCGRRITQQSAASLWAGYCTETCDQGCGGYDDGCGNGCGSSFGSHGGRLRGLFGGFGNSSCGGGCLGSSHGGKLRGMFTGLGGGSGDCGGCDSGCFGYPQGGCGCDAGGCDAGGGGFLSGGLLQGGCFSRSGQRGGGKLKGRKGSNRDCLSGLFSRSRNQCGNSCAYFQESVGHEHGTDGMQSYVSGCGSAGLEGSANQSLVAPVPSVEGQAPLTGN
ncbi:MAG: hypothetical protein ACI87E_004175 [Mariniblastus sp.]|jgi:hypothetical protein